MAERELVIGVTGLNATDNPGPGVAVIRALRAAADFPCRIVGLAYDALDPGLYARGLCDAAFLIPWPSAGREALFARLAEIKARVGLDVLLPTLDAELPALLDREEELAEIGIRLFVPTRRQFEARSKARLAELADEHGLPVPRSEVLMDPSPLYTVHQRLGFPVVIKSPFYGAEICHSSAEAVAAFHKAAAQWGLPIIAQQFVRGEEYCVAALGDGEGGVIGAVPMKKLMITRSGKGWSGVTVGDPELVALTRRVLAALSWRGPCEVELLKTAEGELFVLEINPRFPAWIDLTAGAGQNLPLACARLALGEELEPLPPYRVGTAFVRISINQIVPIDQFGAIQTLAENLAPPDESPFWAPSVQA